VHAGNSYTFSERRGVHFVAAFDRGNDPVKLVPAEKGKKLENSV
jgi:hypothetical protein